MENLKLPTSDHFADAFAEFQQTALFSRLEKKFQVKPYWKKYRLLRMVALVASYAFNGFSALTASALVYFFTASLSGHWLPAALATITALTLLEVSKRNVNGVLWRDLLQFKKVGASLAAVVVLLSALSVASSYFGAKRVIAEFTPPAQLEDVTEKTAQITAQITAIDLQISDARATKWNGTTTTTSARTIEALTKQKTALFDELTRTRARTDQRNDTDEQQHVATTQLKAEYFAAVTLLLELLFILCAFYLEFYDFRSLAEFAKPDEGAKRPQEQHSAQGTATASAAYAIPYQVEKVAPQVAGNGRENGTLTNSARPIGFFGSNALHYNAPAQDIQPAAVVVEADRTARPCLNCGNTYRPRTTWQKYCGPTCRESYHAAQHEGTAFDPAQYRRKRSKTK